MFKNASSIPDSKLNANTHFVYPYYEGLTLIQLKRFDEAKSLFDRLKEDFPDRDLSKVYQWLPDKKLKTENPNQNMEPTVKTPAE